MSIKLMHQVWTLKLTPTEATVLAHLADHANDDGLSFPSVGLVAWKSNLSERTVQLSLRRLREQGLIRPLGKTHGGRGHSTRYRLQLDRGIPKPPYREKGADASPFDGMGEASAPIPGGIEPIKGEIAAGKGEICAPKGEAGAPEPLLTVKERTTKRARAPEATPVPNDFAVSDEMLAWAERLGLAPPAVAIETDKFLDHFRANGDHKKDWGAAWRNWMRRVDDFPPARRRPNAANAANGTRLDPSHYRDGAHLKVRGRP